MFYDDFNDWDDVLHQFDVKEQKWKDSIPLYAIYNVGSYEGDATVLFVNQGKIYLNTGSHCSCNGLEECWDPEEISVQELHHYLTKGQLFSEINKEDKRFENLIRVIEKENVTAEEIQFMFSLIF